MGFPNYITLSRFLLIPVITYFYLHQRYDLSLLFLLLAGLSDLVDGGLARFLKQRTKLGTILDPAADKILMFVLFILFTWFGRIPKWLTAMVIARDVYIVLGVLYLKIVCKKFYVRPTYISKLNTFFQIAVLFLCLFYSYLQTNVLWGENYEPLVLMSFHVSIALAAIFTVSSGLQYTVIGIAIFKGKLNDVSFEEKNKIGSE